MVIVSGTVQERQGVLLEVVGVASLGNGDPVPVTGPEDRAVFGLFRNDGDGTGCFLRKLLIVSAYDAGKPGVVGKTVGVCGDRGRDVRDLGQCFRDFAGGLAPRLRKIPQGF